MQIKTSVCQLRPFRMLVIVLGREDLLGKGRATESTLLVVFRNGVSPRCSGYPQVPALRKFFHICFQNSWHCAAPHPAGEQSFMSVRACHPIRRERLPSGPPAAIFGYFWIRLLLRQDVCSTHKAPARQISEWSCKACSNPRWLGPAHATEMWSGYLLTTCFPLTAVSWVGTWPWDSESCNRAWSYSQEMKNVGGKQAICPTVQLWTVPFVSCKTGMLLIQKVKAHCISLTGV